MPTTLPTLTKTIDNAFMHTWYDIKPDVVDSIMVGTPIWAALKMRGCLTTQVGGDVITRGVRYQLPTTETTKKGKLLPSGETEIETMARWGWRYRVGHVQRSLLDDQKNNGPYKIKSLVATRLQATKDALTQSFETAITAAYDSTEVGEDFQGIQDIVPTYANRATGKFGAIDRSNTWWQANYKAWTANKEQNMVTDMRNAYNTVFANRERPDLILTTQTLFELYEDFGVDASQIVKGVGGLADLGFDTLKFKGTEMIWSSNVTANFMYVLTMKYIEFVYDPTMWFDATEWKTIPLQTDRIMHILCAGNMTCSKPTQQMLIYT